MPLDATRRDKLTRGWQELVILTQWASFIDSLRLNVGGIKIVQINY